DGGQGLPGLQPPRGHGTLDLPADLLVDGLAAGVADDDVHGFTSVFLYMYSIYSNYSLSRGNRKIPREILGSPARRKNMGQNRQRFFKYFTFGVVLSPKL